MGTGAGGAFILQFPPQAFPGAVGQSGVDVTEAYWIFIAMHTGGGAGGGGCGGY